MKFFAFCVTQEYLQSKIWIIVKMQAWARGNRVRRNMPQLTSTTPIMKDKQLMRTNTMGQRSIAPGGTYDMKLEAGQNYDAEVEDRPEFIFKNGAKYLGQWKGQDRHGRGIQIWQDGARYEGDWRFNKAHGQGTFWHVHGDKYDG